MKSTYVTSFNAISKTDSVCSICELLLTDLLHMYSLLLLSVLLLYVFLASTQGFTTYVFLASVCCTCGCESSLFFFYDLYIYVF